MDQTEVRAMQPGERTCVTTKVSFFAEKEFLPLDSTDMMRFSMSKASKTGYKANKSDTATTKEEIGNK